MRALITGAGGQLGSDLARLLPEAMAMTRSELSITDPEALSAVLQRHRPDLVFNCAAYNAVDRAESEPRLAQAVNGTAPGLLAERCRALGIRLVHYSTNYVFAGDRPGSYVESDTPGPLGVYARSKLDGERAVMAAAPGALVIRCAGLYGVTGSAAKGGSFPDRILTRARAGEALRVVADQHLNPTYTGLLARASLDLASGGLSGLVHLVPRDCCTWYDLAVELLALAGLRVSVEPVASSEFPAAARRPAHACLRSERVAALAPWREGLAEYWGALLNR